MCENNVINENTETIGIHKFNKNNNLEFPENTNGKKSVEYRKIIEQLKKSINSNAWDGRWFNRAFMDDGNVLRKFAK